MAVEPIERLTRELARLPGIGQKTAQRLAFHILAMDEARVRDLSVAIFNAKKLVHACPVCGKVELYTAASVLTQAKDEEEQVTCPVCGTRHSPLIGCPSCAVRMAQSGQRPSPSRESSSQLENRRKPPWEK